MALDIHEKGFSISKNQTSWQKVKNMSHFYFGAKMLGMATCSQFVEYRKVG